MVKEINIGPTEGTRFNRQVINLPLFVKVHHPNCGHCIQLKPEWEKLVDILKKQNLGNFAIVDIHSDALKDINFEGLKNIQGFPTIRVIKNKKLIKEYIGNRTAIDMLNFCKMNFNFNIPKSKKTKTKSKKTKTKSKKTKTKSKPTKKQSQKNQNQPQNIIKKIKDKN